MMPLDDDKPRRPNLILAAHRPVSAQVSIQPNIPHHMMLRKAPSADLIHLPTADNSQQKNVVYKTQKISAVKKFRMRSLLWVKPQGVAETSRSATIAQLIPTIIINIAALSFGLSLGFSSVAIPQLLKATNASDVIVPHRSFTMTPEDGSWIASIFGIGAALGSLVYMYVATQIGQRKTILSMAIFDISGWILIGLSQNLSMMLGGRFLTGFAVAGYVPAIQAYVAELAQPQLRGWLSSITMPVVAMGTLAAYSIGTALSWNYVAIAGCFLPVILIPALSSASDTPYWYMQQGDERKAVQVIERFRGKDCNGLSELLAISDTLKPAGSELTFREALHELHQKDYISPMFVLNVLFFLVVSCGSATITFYTVDIMKMAHSSIDEFGSTVILGAFKLFGALLFIPAVMYNQKRTLLCVSSLIMGCSLMAFGFILYANQVKPVGNVFENLEWLPLLCLSLFVIADSAGFGPIPSLYINDFFIPELRPLIVGLTTTFANLKLFVVVKSFPNIVGQIGASWTFWIYSFVCFSATFFAFISIRRARRKSSLDLENYVVMDDDNLRGGSSRSNSSTSAPYSGQSRSNSATNPPYSRVSTDNSYIQFSL